jgi:hypothetical protein
MINDTTHLTAGRGPSSLPLCKLNQSSKRLIDQTWLLLSICLLASMTSRVPGCRNSSSLIHLGSGMAKSSRKSSTGG